MNTAYKDKENLFAVSANTFSVNAPLVDASPSKSDDNSREYIISGFRQMPRKTQRELLEQMQDITEYEDLDFLDYQDKVGLIAIGLDNAKQLCQILREYFRYDESYFENDSEKVLFFCNYNRIQSLVKVIEDLVWDAAMTADKLSLAELKQPLPAHTQTGTETTG